MAYLTYRVQITRDESRPSGTPIVEITAYIDRVPETNEPEFVATDLVRVNEAPGRPQPASASSETSAKMPIVIAISPHGRETVCRARQQ